MTDPLQIVSMTGFARVQVARADQTFAWELRSVNGRGLDIKLKLPPGLEAMELPLRNLAASRLRRGNVTGTLTLKRESAATIQADAVVLETVKNLALELVKAIPGAPPPRAELLLALPGVMRNVSTQDRDGENEETIAAVEAAFAEAVEELVAARAAEGQKLFAIVDANLLEIEKLYRAACQEGAGQTDQLKAKLLAQVAELLGEAHALPEDRLAQEIALLATKADVREELDRLSAHISSAKALLAEGVGIGRKLDFLMQEFNREANTLCSKSSSIALTNTGLALKAAIEQLREQVQNIE
ncbi:MAG: YicC family protein [Rhodospirillales bacterium]|nr:YicC family protein [Rhodospirillales bacterium]